VVVVRLSSFLQVTTDNARMNKEMRDVIMMCFFIVIHLLTNKPQC